MADLATLQLRLAEVDAAIHALLTGKLAVTVRNAAGRYVQYAQPQLPALRTYRAELAAQIDALQGGTMLNRRPIYARF